MKIIVVGCGKVGYILAKSLSAESGADVTIIDSKSDLLEKASETMDALFIQGDALNTNTLIDAGAREADLLIAVMNADEKNILCCISAKHIGVKHTVARVRTPDYALDTNNSWKSLGVDLIINPELETAREISRLLRFPTVDDIDIFVGGRVELVSFRVSEAREFFVGKSVSQIFYKRNANVLLSTVERNDGVIIPHGDLVFEQRDIIRVLGRPSDIMNFFSMTGKNTEKIKTATIIGGGRLTYYLVGLLHRHSHETKIKIIEMNKEKCEMLSVKFPRCLIINGDGTNEDIISDEITDKTGAVLCLTDRDEENAVIALYSMQSGIRKVIVKINHINLGMVKNLGLGSIVSPKSITSDQIIRYKRGLANTAGDVKTIHKIFDNDEDKVEATEIQITKKAGCLNTPIKNIQMKKGILIGCIVRNSNIIIPSGESIMQLGDRVIIISKNDSINELNDVLAD